MMKKPVAHAFPWIIATIFGWPSVGLGQVPEAARARPPVPAKLLPDPRCPTDIPCRENRDGRLYLLLPPIEPSAAIGYTPEGLSTFMTVFHNAAARGVENATLRAFNATRNCPDGKDCGTVKEKVGGEGVQTPAETSPRLEPIEPPKPGDPAPPRPRETDGKPAESSPRSEVEGPPTDVRPRSSDRTTSSPDQGAPGRAAARVPRVADSIWYAGNTSGKKFLIAFGPAGSPKEGAKIGQGQGLRGSASFVDPADGTLRLYTDGIHVYNGRTDEQLLDGEGLTAGREVIQAALIVPFAGDRDRFYVFANSGREVSYSVADLSGTGPGKIISKNTALTSGPTGQALGVAPHADGRSFWVMVFHNSDRIDSYRVDDSGVNPRPGFVANHVLLPPDGRRLDHPRSRLSDRRRLSWRRRSRDREDQPIHRHASRLDVARPERRGGTPRGVLSGRNKVVLFLADRGPPARPGNRREDRDRRPS